MASQVVVRRIEAVAVYMHSIIHVILKILFASIAEDFKCAKSDILSKINQTKEHVKTQEKIIADLQNKIVNSRWKVFLGFQM